MNNSISILDSNIKNIKNNLQRFLLLINNVDKKKHIVPNNYNIDENTYNDNQLNGIHSNDNNLDYEIDKLLNKYKYNDNKDYMEHKLKKLLSHYSINNN